MIKLYKLVTGEDIIAEEFSFSETHTVITKPLSVGITEKGVAFMPWMILSSSENFVLKNQHIILSTDPMEELLNKYSEVTGKVIVPESKIVTPFLH